MYSVCTQPCLPTGSSARSCYGPDWLKVRFLFKYYYYYAYSRASLFSLSPEVVYHSLVMFMTVHTHRPAVWMRARAIHHQVQAHTRAAAGALPASRWRDVDVEVISGIDPQSSSPSPVCRDVLSMTTKKKSMIWAKSRAVQGERWD